MKRKRKGREKREATSLGGNATILVAVADIPNLQFWNMCDLVPVLPCSLLASFL
jgi:hypothetical protein